MASNGLKPTVDEVVRVEIDSVRARGVILRELESGPKTGTYLREKIKEDMIHHVEDTEGKVVDAEKFNVTDPKLYFNTRHLEDIGVITSRKDSQQRLYSLQPKAIHAIRRVLDITRPTTVVTSMSRPDDIRGLMHWFMKESEPHYRNLRIVVERERFSKGVVKDLERFIPAGATKRYSAVWHELPLEVVGYYEGNRQGDLMATYAYIERVILEEVTEHNIVFDLTTAPPIIGIAFCLLATDYSIPAMYIRRREGTGSSITHYLAGRGLI
ncbi:MAG: hypothetical protein HXY34_04200 [Candidatus Thorarchaeota archaeon]|nr:hypothetical protein [Candidatus Thorarchaeota archaeon]